MIIKEDDFKVLSGNAKPISKTADGGNTITSHFCSDCGSTMWRDGPSFPGLKVLKVGTLDDVGALAKAKPAAELFAPTRVEWVNEIPGAAQKKPCLERAAGQLSLSMWFRSEVFNESGLSVAFRALGKEGLLKYPE